MLVQSPQKGGSGQTGLIRVIASGPGQGELARTSLGQYARDRGMPDIYSYQKLTTRHKSLLGTGCAIATPFIHFVRGPGVRGVTPDGGQ